MSHPTVQRTFGIALSIVVSVSAGLSHAAESRWSYAGKTGPANWAKLDKSFAVCAEGMAQSPIDIPDATVRKGDFPSLLFNYHPSPLEVIDNGRTVSAKFAPGSHFTLEGAKY